MLVHAWGGILQTPDQTSLSLQSALPVTAIFKMKLTTAKVNWSNCPVALQLRVEVGKDGSVLFDTITPLRTACNVNRASTPEQIWGLFVLTMHVSLRLLNIGLRFGFEEKF
ncbi:hypothetical protein CDAR_191951 [Caerostris darwini]|uniref:Uncharacterized protein n=1 Tax=Caerostris darwini TaxID=1538125 RepID=A0AAV4NSC9_9ARAC|nr:hypothetical protein CDAR_191951 [Caerostris darwini]